MCLGICQMNNYLCNNETFYKQNANGFVTTTWGQVDGIKITDFEGASILSDDSQGANFYNKQSLQNNINDQYTVITKFDGELNLVWEKVYKASSTPSEHLIFDESKEYLHTILKIKSDQKRDSEYNIVKFEKDSGELYSSHVIKFNDSQIVDLSSLYYHDDKYSFLVHQDNGAHLF